MTYDYDVTIIIPHYESINTLNKLLTTIPYEKKNIQIIVVDDNSPNQKEAFYNLSLKFKRNNNIEFMLNTKGKGAGGARNVGLERARGKWVMFADDDDYFLENFYTTLSTNFNSECDAIFFPMTSIDVRTNKKSDRHLIYSKLVYDYLNQMSTKNEVKLRYGFGVPWSKLLKLSFLRENDIFFDEVISANDYSFSTKVGYYLNKFEVRRDIFYCVTRNKGSLTNIISEEVFDSRVDVFIWNYNFLKENIKKDTFNELNLNGFSLITRSIEYKLGLKKTILVIIKLRKQKVKVMDKNWLNPLFSIKKIKNHYKKNVNEIYVK